MSWPFWAMGHSPSTCYYYARDSSHTQPSLGSSAFLTLKFNMLWIHMLNQNALYDELLFVSVKYVVLTVVNVCFNLLSRDWRATTSCFTLSNYLLTPCRYSNVLRSSSLRLPLDIAMFLASSLISSILLTCPLTTSFYLSLISFNSLTFWACFTFSCWACSSFWMVVILLSKRVNRWVSYE